MKAFRIFFLLAPVFVFSCKTPQPLPGYVENLKDTSITPATQVPQLLIEKNDILSIQVYSASTKPEVDQLYNLPGSGAGSSSAGNSGFLVDANGNIEYPRLGVIHAEGMTKEQLGAEIKKRLTTPVEFLKDPSVIIRFINFKVTVLGEVGHTGPIPVQGERLNLLEAIGLAGDITKYGMRSNVKVIRENNGKLEIGLVDLTSDKLFESPYYNLKQNDVILVQARKDVAKQENQSLVAQRISMALGIITSAAFIYNIFK